MSTINYHAMAVTSLTQEEKDAIIYDAREGDLEYLQEVFTSIVPGSLLPSIEDDITQSTPVHMAAANGHLAVVEYLLGLVLREEAVALANRANESGNTPLHWAAYNGHLNIVKLLVEQYDADVFAKNGSGHDALFEAETNGKSEVENWFLLKFAIEDDVKVEQSGDDTKITYTPGKESYELEKQAADAVKAAEVEKVKQQTEQLQI